MYVIFFNISFFDHLILFFLNLTFNLFLFSFDQRINIIKYCELNLKLKMAISHGYLLFFSAN